MRKLTCIFPLFFAFVTFGIYPETDSTKNENTILFEKVYLHVDRELYSPGEDIWFKSYLVSGINNKLIPGYKNIYVQLISDLGKVMDNRLLLSIDGTARGDFELARNFPNGTYTIRAYTNYQQNYGPESYFHKKIVVAAPDNSFELEGQTAETKSSGIDASFMPEGGHLVLNTANRVAFKIIDESGKGISAKGKIVDETGREVVSFRTRYKGMGSFLLMPQEGKNYFALIDEHPDFHQQLKPVQYNGVAISYKAEGSYLIFTLSRNLKKNTPEEFTLRASHKGIDLFHSRIEMNEFQHAQRLFKGLFPLGISKISVSNIQGEIVAERLVFVQNSNDNLIEILTDKNEYQTREKVELDVSSLLPENDTIFSTLSVSVVHEDYFSATGNNQTIESYLLLDSDLKGSIESPASFFVDEEVIKSDEKLDLVMMVNGWRSYYWNDLEQFRGLEMPGWDDYGLTIKGRVIKQWGRKPVQNGKVVLGPFSRNFLFEEAFTDDYGKFYFDRLYLKDSALIMINAKTAKGGKRTDILLDSMLIFENRVDSKPLKGICPDIFVPMKFYRTQYYSKLAEREFKLKSGSILLDEIDIEGKHMYPGDGHFRLYGEPDVVFEITDEDHNYIDILDYLIGRAPGVLVSGDKISIRNSPNNPLLLIDGLEVAWDRIREISMGDVDKIEILKTGFSTSAFGSRGGEGVIAVLTKMGKGEWENTWERVVHGRITPRFRGFKQAREFYSPKYTYENINSERPDFRPTLFWNPDLLIKDREAKVEFFTSDHLARYKIIVEGISKRGKICFGTGLLNVTVRR